MTALKIISKLDARVEEEPRVVINFSSYDFSCWLVFLGKRACLHCFLEEDILVSDSEWHWNFDCPKIY